MTKCPECNKWTLEFDDYFGRFRCFNPDCKWIQTSLTERVRRLSDRRREPRELRRIEMCQHGGSVIFIYDDANDALVVQFGEDGPALEVPDPSGRMFWRVTRSGDSVVGLVILSASKWAVQELGSRLCSRRQNVESKLRHLPSALKGSRSSRYIVSSLEDCGSSEGCETESDCEFSKAVQELSKSFIPVTG